MWLAHRRAKQHHNNDIWDLRANRVRELSAIGCALARGTYSFSPLRRLTTKTGEELDVWCARDALVLKALAICLAKVLPRSTRCTNLKTHGGLKGAVRAVADELSSHRFVLRTDVKSYYASIVSFQKWPEPIIFGERYVS
jgi:RNA-directed DNA polymerase